MTEASLNTRRGLNGTVTRIKEDKDRQINRQTDTQLRNTQSRTETDKTDRQTNTQAETHSDEQKKIIRKTLIDARTQARTHTDEQTNRQTDRPHTIKGGGRP